MEAKKRAHHKPFVKLITITLYTILVIIAIVKHGIGVNTILEVVVYGIFGFGIYYLYDDFITTIKEVLS